MLRAVAFQNFIYFRDYQSMQFQDGPNFIVGANATGKSGIFELIRRCLSRTTNTSTTNVADKAQPAFTICKFQIEEGLSTEIPSRSTLYSALFVKHLTKESTQIYKLVYISKLDLPGKCYLDIHTYGCTAAEENVDDPQDTKSCYVDNDDIESMLSRMLKEGDDNEQNRAMSCVLALLQIFEKAEPEENTKEEKGRRTNSSCENILKTINPVIPVTFPIRSLGPIQWSHSEHIGERTGNYGEASRKAEIIQQLLLSDEVDSNKADSIFRAIIYPLDYTFRKSGMDITVNDGEHDIPLLKTPEGIIEAKQFALVMAHTKYQTLILEEPDRGMHPPMIQNVRDLVLRKHKKQVLILTSHKPAMINHWSMKRMYACRRKRDVDGRVRHSVSKMSVGHHEEEKLKQMLFASSVLFVEGITDKNIIGAIMDGLLEMEHLQDFEEGQLDDIKKIAAGTQIIVADGSKSYNTLKTMSANLQIPFAFLFDRDTVFECNPSTRPKRNVTRWTNKLLYITRSLIKLLKQPTQNIIGDTKHGKSVQKFLDSETALGGKLRDVWTDYGCSKPISIDTIATFLELFVLPVGGTALKPQSRKTYDIIEQVKEKDAEKYLRENNKLFVWTSGNLEDMICRSVLDIQEPQSDVQKTAANIDSRKERLLRDVFLCDGYNEDFDNAKNPMKETLKQMSIDVAERLAACLLESSEIKRFLQFLLDVEKKRW